MPDRQDTDAHPLVVIVGAGFAGLHALDGLAKSNMSVTLIDRNSYSTFQPLLYQVATAGLTSTDVAYPVASAVRKAGAHFRKGEVAGIDLQARKVLLANGETRDYDYLILATGVTAAFFDVPGAAEHSLSLYTRRDAITLRNRLIAELESRSVNGDQRDFSVTIVGGGATGVELAGTLAELRNIALPAAFPDIAQSRVKVRLVELGRSLLGPFRPSLRDYARKQLIDRGVEVLLGTSITQVLPDQVVLEDKGGRAGASAMSAQGQPVAPAGPLTLHSDVTVWAAGITAPDWIGKLDLPTGRGGRIRTGRDLRVVGQDRIFAAGDIALIDDEPLPQLAATAIQQGRHVAAQIKRLVAGKETKPFAYWDKGIMATIGHRSAVVELPQHIRVRGTLAWLAWLALHLFELLGNRNRIAALNNLCWRYVSWSRGGGIIVGDDPPEHGA